jgi:putative transcriptional regulator
MINFHPSTQQLDDFVAGNCEPTLALMISAHTDMCSHCMAKSQQLQSIQSVGAMSDVPAEHGPDFSGMMARIVQMPSTPGLTTLSAKQASIELDGKQFLLPRALRPYAKKTGDWSRLVGKLWQAPVDMGDLGRANFIYMEKGGKVPEHTHRGTEITLVIDGQYSDGMAHYDCGDLTVLDGQHKHLPHSEADEGCLVFSIVDKPLFFTAGIARLLNPFSNLFFK